MRIAIVGTGISGLSAAYYLSQNHEVTVFEADNRLGGHTATKTVQFEGQTFDIDTGFIVFNDWTYPNFIALMDELNVASQPTSMGFSVFDSRTGFEYAGNNLNTLFSCRSSLLHARHWQMIKDIVRFNRESIDELEKGLLDETLTMRQYLTEKNYGEAFIHRYLVPMGSAIWSTAQADMFDFPMQFFVRFFKNHGLLNIVNRPQWRVISGGSKSYIKPLTAPYLERIRLNARVDGIERDKAGVSLHVAGQKERFDQVVIASHSDQALALLADGDDRERSVLGAIRYQENDVVLHTDTAMLPRLKRTWSSWNYALATEPDALPVLTYNMNILQGLQAPTTFCVTLNANDKIAEDKILGAYRYAHPVFTRESVAAQQRWHEINGVRNTWFCGAYWRNGFHEDGLSSALNVVNAINKSSVNNAA